MQYDPQQPQAKVGDLRQLVTLPQAAHILDVHVEQVRKAIDRHIVTATYVQQGNRKIRALDGVDVLCLRLREWLKGGIREKLYFELKQAPDRELLTQIFHVAIDPAQLHWSKALFSFVCDAATTTVAEIASLGDETTRLVDDEGRLLGSGVEAHRIAALVTGGMTVEEVLEDYPNLNRHDVEAAVKYAQAKPKLGRPFPSRTSKSVLRKNGGGGLAAAFALAREDQQGGGGDER